MSKRIPAVVFGATGYVGGELLRFIATHPSIGLAAAVSESSPGTPIAQVFPTLAGSFPRAEFRSADRALEEIADGDRLAVFSAAPHGASAPLVADLLERAEARGIEARVVDSSADFRYPDSASFEAVYGHAHPAPRLLADFACAIPEHSPDVPAKHIGHPGCFATASLLAAVPIFATGLIEADVFIAGITGSSGSGRSASAGTHHPERHSNLYAYQPLAHRHRPEIEALIRAATGQAADVQFVPHSGPFVRGIYVTLHARLRESIDTGELSAHFRDYYRNSRFVQVLDRPPRIKDVAASNNCHLSVTAERQHAVVMCAIDNLVKGAAGGAVQWMNRLWGLPEDSGLGAPAPAWI